MEFIRNKKRDLEDRPGYVNSKSLLEGKRGTNEKVINKEIIKENLSKKKKVLSLQVKGVTEEPQVKLIIIF